MQRRGALLTAAGVAVMLAGVGVTVAVAAGSDPTPVESGDQLVIEASTSTPAATSVITSTTVVVLPTTAAPEQPAVQQVPAEQGSGDTGQVNPQPLTEPTVQPSDEDVTAPPPPPPNCWMDYSDPQRPQGVEVCDPPA